MARRKERPHEYYDADVEVAAVDGTAREHYDERVQEDAWSTHHAIGAPSNGIGGRPQVKHGWQKTSTHRFPGIFGREED